MLEPDPVTADEPVSALNVSIQAQILLKLGELKVRRNLSFVFISHDLGVVRHFCERIAVMYLGRLVELGPVRGSSITRSTPIPTGSVRGTCA